MTRIITLEDVRATFTKDVRIDTDGISFDNAGTWPTSLMREQGMSASFRASATEMCLLFGDDHAVNLADLCALVCVTHKPTHFPVDTITTPGELHAYAKQKRLRKDWHEPDEQDVTAEWIGGTWCALITDDERIEVDARDLLNWVAFPPSIPTAQRTTDLDTLLFGARQ